MVSHTHSDAAPNQAWSVEARAMLLLALPLILTNFAYVALTTIDIVVLGQLGTAEIAAGGLAIALFNQLRTTGSGLLTSVSNLVAEAQAQGNQQRVRDLLVAGFFWATLCGLVFSALLLLLERPLIWLGVDARLAGMAVDFLLLAAPGLLPCLWLQTLRHFTTGLKYPGPLLVITLISIALTVGLNYALVFGHFGLPALGMQGVALTTTLVFVLAFVMFLLVVLNNRVLAPWFKASGLRFSADAIASVWKLGLPIAGTYASEAGFFSVLTLLIGTLGVEALAAQTVLNQIIYIVFMISAGISHAASIHISEACGAADYQRARRLGFVALALGVAAMLLVAVPYVLMPDAIVALFISAEQSSNSKTLALAASGLLIAVVLQVFDASQNVGNGILRGVGDTAGPFRISLFGYWLVGLPAAWLLGIAAQLDIYGVWIGQTIGLAVTAALLVVAFRKRLAHLDRPTAMETRHAQ
ncbi:MATE family efflux transporter [Pseudomonas sp. 21LCFQ02]|uniref:MATE family efflux transporter n=1 Tax=Pseudomonas sp. 21LCFQ02 TaxID=2957505 RepID=UPI00209B9786|nr:MATE family efflux transporter [Pseudomonas sp. 21LCFQ02]MCO8169446.1 MATE family efflux transporter [Pseudomonas sp. 21LCFQ02]